MRIAAVLFAVLLTCGAAEAAAPPVNASACPNPDAIGTSRTIVVDPNEHPFVGTMQYHETLPLADHEIVLTFDDGPLSPYSNRILDILASQCVKANYFLIGKMAHTYPKIARRMEADGHTIGTHSQNHPFSFHRMSVEQAAKEIDDGIASVTAALGHDPAPFFRVPGLLRSHAVEEYLVSHHIMTWSADFVADDWKHISAKEIVKRALTRIEARGRGILLLHDIHPATVAALPVILRELKARGYHIVHVVPVGSGLLKTATLPEQWQPHRMRASVRESTPAIPATGARQHAKADITGTIGPQRVSDGGSRPDKWPALRRALELRAAAAAKHLDDAPARPETKPAHPELPAFSPQQAAAHVTSLFSSVLSTLWRPFW